MLDAAPKLFGTATRTKVLVGLALLGESYPRELSRLLGLPLMSVQRASTLSTERALPQAASLASNVRCVSIRAISPCRSSANFSCGLPNRSRKNAARLKNSGGVHGAHAKRSKLWR